MTKKEALAVLSVALPKFRGLLPMAGPQVPQAIDVAMAALREAVAREGPAR